MDKTPSITQAIQYFGSRWQDAKLKEGDIFCQCQNPQHGGCSIATRQEKVFCEHCLQGCLKRK